MNVHEPLLRRHSRGRRVAMATALLTLGGGSLAIYVARDQFIEQWHIYRLETNDPLTVLDSVRELGRRKSVRAVPAIVRAMKRATDARNDRSGDWLLIGPADMQPGSSVDSLPPEHERLELQKAIHDIGPASASGLLKMISHDDPDTALWAANLLPRVMAGVPLGTCVHYPWQSRHAMLRAFELGDFRIRLPQALRKDFDTAVERLRVLER